jgi:dTDP-4-amino-4,6-dideoxygalactose transaminase
VEGCRVRKLRNWGSEKKYHHPEIGFNSRLDTLQAVVLSAKLNRLDAWNEARRQATARYDQLLAGSNRSNCRRPSRQRARLASLRGASRQAGRGAGEAQRRGDRRGHPLPGPLHLHGALSDLGYRQGDFPEAERAANEILSLPMYPHITEEQQGRVAEALRQAVG